MLCLLLSGHRGDGGAGEAGGGCCGAGTGMEWCVGEDGGGEYTVMVVLTLGGYVFIQPGHSHLSYLTKNLHFEMHI